MLEAYDPQETAGRVTTQSPPSREAGSRVMGHVTVPESTSAGRRGPEPLDTWTGQSPPQVGGEVRSHRTRGSAETHLNREARSGAIELIAARGCTLCYLS
jgi:hypothetical protein